MKGKNPPPGHNDGEQGEPGEKPGKKPEESNVLQFKDRNSTKKTNRTHYPAPGLGGPSLKPGDEGWEPAGIEEKIASLAAIGLNEDEIETTLEAALEADPISDERFEEAVELGRIKGLVRIKAAQYEAALQGKVTAQAQVLARLEGDMVEEGEGEERDIKVTRKIIMPKENEEGD